MRQRSFLLILALAVVTAVLATASTDTKSASPKWDMNATIIEACSCPMFCQCYFNSAPATHAAGGVHAGHAHGTYCKFNNAFHVNKGHYGDVDLAGAKFWVAGDLGADFSKGDTDWAVLTFDPSVTKQQRDGITAALGKLYPVKWRSFSIAKDSPMEWKSANGVAHAALDAGKTAEVGLKQFQGMSGDPVVINNLPYFGASHNDGFILMPNTVEAYRTGDKAFEYKGTNGFMITLDVNSNNAM